MASVCTDIDVVLRQINRRMRKLQKSDSEKTAERGRLNHVINERKNESRAKGLHWKVVVAYIPFNDYSTTSKQLIYI